MSGLIRELFERHQAKLLNLDYEELKKQFDRHEKCFTKRYATFGDFEKLYELWLVAWNARQPEIDQLKAKNTALVHALVNTNAEKTKWAHNYWSQVERTAEYGAMLISNDSELAVSCFKKEKEIEKLKAQLIDQGQRFNDQSQKVRDLEFKCEGLEKRTTDATKHLNDVRNKGMDQSCYLALKALRGES